MIPLWLFAAIRSCSTCDAAGTLDGFVTLHDGCGNASKPCSKINRTCESGAWGTVVLDSMPVRFTTLKYYMDTDTTTADLRKALFDYHNASVFFITDEHLNEKTRVVTADAIEYGCSQTLPTQRYPPLPVHTGLAAVGHGRQRSLVQVEAVIIIVSSIVTIGVVFVTFMVAPILPA